MRPAKSHGRSLTELRKRQKERAARSARSGGGKSTGLPHQPPGSTHQPPGLHQPPSQSLGGRDASKEGDPKVSPPSPEVISFYGSSTTEGGSVPTSSMVGQEAPQVEGSVIHQLDTSSTGDPSLPQEKGLTEDAGSVPPISSSLDDKPVQTPQIPTCSALVTKTTDLPSYAPERSEPKGSEGYDHLLQDREPEVGNHDDQVDHEGDSMDTLRAIFDSSDEEDGSGGDNDIHESVEVGPTPEEIEREFQRAVAGASKKAEGGVKKMASAEDGAVLGRKKRVAHPNAPVRTNSSLWSQSVCSSPVSHPRV